MAGMLPSKKPVSLMIATSAVSRSRLAVSQASRPSEPALLGALEHVPDVDREAAAGRAGSRPPPWRGRGSGPCRRLPRARASGRRRRPARTAARSTGRADRPAGRRSGRRRGGGRPVGVQPVGVDDRVEARLLDRDVLEAGGPEGRPRATRRPGARRARAPATPRCWGSAGTPCSSPAERRGSRSRCASRAASASGRRHAGPRVGQETPECTGDVRRGAGAALPATCQSNLCATDAAPIPSKRLGPTEATTGATR